MTDRPRPYDPDDPPRFGEWVWVGGLGQTPAISKSQGKPRIWIAVAVVVALVAWSVAAFRGCHREPAPVRSQLIFGASSLGADGALRGRIVIKLPEGEFIDAGPNGEEIGANLVMTAKVADAAVEIVPARIKYVQAERTLDSNGRPLLGGDVAVGVTLRDVSVLLPGEVTVSYDTTLVDEHGKKTRDVSGQDSVRFGD
jgi:hypothetical protein